MNAENKNYNKILKKISDWLIILENNGIELPEEFDLDITIKLMEVEEILGDLFNEYIKVTEENSIESN